MPNTNLRLAVGSYGERGHKLIKTHSAKITKPAVSFEANCISIKAIFARLLSKLTKNVRHLVTRQRNYAYTLYVVNT